MSDNLHKEKLALAETIARLEQCLETWHDFDIAFGINIALKAAIRRMHDLHNQYMRQIDKAYKQDQAARSSDGDTGA